MTEVITGTNSENFPKESERRKARNLFDKIDTVQRVVRDTIRDRG